MGNDFTGSAASPTAAAPRYRDARGRPYEPAVGPRLKIVLVFIFACVALLGATGAYLFALRTLGWLRGVDPTIFSLWMTLAHIVVGVALIVPFLYFGCAHMIASRSRPNRRAVKLGVAL